MEELGRGPVVVAACALHGMVPHMRVPPPKLLLLLLMQRLAGLPRDVTAAGRALRGGEPGPARGGKGDVALHLLSIHSAGSCVPAALRGRHL